MSISVSSEYQLNKIKKGGKGMNYTTKFIKKGNIKVGNMWTFNKLAGAGILAGCKGTCGKYCKGCYNADNPKKSDCYVFKSYVTYGWEKSTVVKSHIKNTISMRTDIGKAFNDLQLQLKRTRTIPETIRVHASGELETSQELILWIDMAKHNPKTKFYLYTKAFDIIEESFSKIDLNVMPKNLFINISIWHENGINEYNKWKHLDCIRAFVYDDGYDYKGKIDIDCHCPAYDINGKLSHELTCDKCKICFQKKAKVCACYSH